MWKRNVFELLLYSYEYDMTTVSIECIKLYAIVLCNVYKRRIYIFLNIYGKCIFNFFELPMMPKRDIHLDTVRK